LFLFYLFILRSNYKQGCQIGRFAAKFQKFGRISSLLAVRFLGWPFGFFWPFFKSRLAEYILGRI